MTPSKRDEYARECGFDNDRHARGQLECLAAQTRLALRSLEIVERRVTGSGYIRRNLLALALYATGALLRVVRHDLDAVGGEEGKT